MPKNYPLLYCVTCGEQIDPAKIIKAGSHPPEHCSRDCVHEDHRRNGHFARMGRIGNLSQQAVKAQTGKIPAYEKRRDAIISSNKIHPRRKKEAGRPTS